MEQRKCSNDGGELLRNVASHMNKMTGKGDAGVSQPRMPIRGSRNPNSDSESDGPRISKSHKQIQVDYQIGGATKVTYPSFPSSSIGVDNHDIAEGFGFSLLFDSVMEQRKCSNDGGELLRNVASRMNKMTGKGDAGVSQPRMPIRGSRNPNSDSESDGPRISKSHKQIQVDYQIGGATKVTYPSFPSSSIGVDNHDIAEGVGAECQDGINPISSHPVHDLQLGKHELWPLLSKEKGQEITNIVCNGYVRLSKPASMPKGALIAKDYPSTKSVSTRLLKEELTRIPIWVKLHDVPLQVFEEDGISLIATFIGKPIMLDSYTKADLVDVVTIGIPSLSGDDFTKETIHVVSPPIVTTLNVAPTIEKSNDGFQMVGKKKKRKGKSKSTNGGQFAGHSVKQIVRYELKASTNAPKKGDTIVSNPSKSSSMLKTDDSSPKKDNFTTSNSFSALNDEEEDDEEVDNVHDESANLFPNTKTGGRASFTAAVG
nr:hypothetical protein [Tanacetum cinerariifolium]